MVNGKTDIRLKEVTMYAPKVGGPMTRSQNQMDALERFTPEELLNHRYEKFRRMGEFEESAVTAN